MEAGFKRQRERAGGAINLFGDDELNKTNASIPDVKERSPQEILAWEKETLGFYMSGHPLDKFREKLSALKKSKDLEKFLGRRVKVGGIITEARRITTKKGDSMAFVKLEDFDGEIDVTIFPRVFYDVSKILLVDDVVVVEGRVESSNDTVQILADRVTAAQDYVADFWLTLPAQLDTLATFDSLKKIFSENAGNSQIFLNQDGKWKKIPQKISNVPAVRDELKNLLGAGNVRVY